MTSVLKKTIDVIGHDSSSRKLPLLMKYILPYHTQTIMKLSSQEMLQHDSITRRYKLLSILDV